MLPIRIKFWSDWPTWRTVLISMMTRTNIQEIIRSICENLQIPFTREQTEWTKIHLISNSQSKRQHSLESPITKREWFKTLSGKLRNLCRRHLPPGKLSSSLWLRMSLIKSRLMHQILHQYTRSIWKHKESVLSKLLIRSETYL